jgi:flagellar biogenesis protein FliO
MILSTLPSATLPSSNPNLIPDISGLAYAVGVLFLVCVGAYVSIKLLYGKNAMNRLGFGKSLIHIVDRYPLSTHRFLLTIEIGGKYYLLGITEHSINLLTELDSEILAKDLNSLGQNAGFAPFNAYLTALSQHWKKSKKEPPNAS